jgi:hypothetical protein
MEVSREGRIVWTPLAEDVGHEWTLTFRATDSDGASTIHNIRLSVSEGQPLDPPILLSPGEGEEVDDLRPTIRVENPEAPNGEMSIHFELDVESSFGSPHGSGPVPAGAIVSEGTTYFPFEPDGTTSWTINEDLEDGSRYYVQVWASDDIAGDGPKVTSFFWVLSSGGNGDDTPGGGCECRTAPSRGFPGAVLFTTVAGLVLLRRRS